MAANLQPIVDLLIQTTDPKHSKQGNVVSAIAPLPEYRTNARVAGASLEQAEKSPGFSLALLQIVGSDSYPQTARLAASLYFKNFVRRSWVDEDGNHKLPQDEVAHIKRDIVGLMIACPSNIQAQLGDAISIIADSDFWQRWETLVGVC